ncbi:glutathione S-transferase family protein [Pseudomaricurvus alcaniphilus]|uniref:glutathione S-transferase family protein n=1 Tax=Pseudomaricurvus alcaniphilus TaxID=1166482 RepID=UPI00140D744E|nr:glutathione S-transferase family protein [Pseudomaricurvus alcaniphilus]NHN39061.1 glutathione S-transferase family protein [Pseudomaricurvus alcaniphilus]
MITVYGLPKSRSTRVLWALEEVQQDYTFIPLDFLKGEQLQPEYLRINPAGKVPALLHEDFVLTESAAIVNYVATEFGDDLIPRNNNRLRAEYDRWCFFTLSELEQPLWTIGKHKFALPAEKRVPAVLETANWEHEKALGLLSQGLGEKTYILGDQFSGADILLGHTLRWGLAFKRPLPQQNLQDYLARLEARPALQAAVQRESQAAA